MNRDVGWLAQSRTTKTLLRQLSVTYPLGARRVTYLITHHIMLLRNLTRMRELLLVVYGDLLFIVPILHPILGIPALLAHQTLLAGLLGIVRGIDGCGIVSNSTQSFSISTGMRERPGDVIVKDIEGTPPLRPRLLESLKSAMENYQGIGKLTSTQLPLLVRMQRSQGLKVLDLTQCVLLQASRILSSDFWSFEDVQAKSFKQDQHQLRVNGG
jgi:hypothetical protein